METSAPEAGLRVDCVGIPGTTIVHKNKNSAPLWIYHIKTQCTRALIFVFGNFFVFQNSALGFITT